MASQESRDALFIPSDYRQNFKEVIAKRSDLVQVDGGRMKATGADVTYYPGQVLGLATSGPDAGLWKAYPNANTDGSQVAAGVLKEELTMDAAGVGSLAVIIKEGVLFKDLLIGLDAGAITSLNGAVTVESGVNLIRVRA
jgi:hypothetical protein